MPMPTPYALSTLLPSMRRSAEASDAGLDGSHRSAARLRIVPGATHYNILSTTMVANMVSPFLS
jgi:hypothetical protein